MTLKRKLLLLSLSCFLLVVGIVLFEPKITLWLSNKPVFFKTILSWTFGLSVLIAALIPFGMWAVSISDWWEEVRDASSIYGKNDSD